MRETYQELDFDIFIFCANVMIESGGNGFSTGTKPPFSNIRKPDLVDRLNFNEGIRRKYPSMKAFKMAIGMPNYKGC